MIFTFFSRQHLWRGHRLWKLHRGGGWIWVVSNILVLQYRLFQIFLSYNMSCFEYFFLQCELLKMKNVKVGMVQRGEVDIGGGMFSLMKERAVNFKCLLTKILNLKFFLHFLPLFRRWWTLATASVLRRIQSWWKLQGNIYIVLSDKSFSRASF